MVLTVLSMGMVHGCLESEPKAIFNSTFKKRSVNLSNRVGDEFSVVRDEDTIPYRISFSKPHRINYIIRSDTDTVFQGTVNNMGGFYLFNKKLDDGNFRIHAVSFSDSTVTGLQSGYTQSYLLADEIAAGSFTDLIVDTTDKFLLRPYRKSGKALFQKVLLDLDTEPIIWPAEEMAEPDDTFDDLSDGSVTKPESLVARMALADPVVDDFYPNPVDRLLNVDLASGSESVGYELINLNGKVMQAGNFERSKNILDFGGYTSGIYLLTIPSSGETHRIVKQ